MLESTEIARIESAKITLSVLQLEPQACKQVTKGEARHTVYHAAEQVCAEGE